MQHKMLCVLWEVGSDGVLVIPIHEDGGDMCLFIVLLFRTRYVRCFRAFWCIFFMRVLMIDFGIFRSTSLLMKSLCSAPLTLDVMVMRGWVLT